MTNKTNIRFSWITVLVLAAFWLFCASFYNDLPDQVPVHWNIHGEVDNYGHKSLVTLVMPFLPLAVYVLMTFTPRIDPKRNNYSKFGPTYEKIRTLIVAVMAGIALLPLLAALGHSIDIGLIMRIFLPLMFIGLGNYMGKIRHNYFVGIKVPWTLASEEVWNKTHRLYGKLMVAGGILALAGAAAPPTAGFIILMAGIIIPAVIAVIYSYLMYTKITK